MHDIPQILRGRAALDRLLARVLWRAIYLFLFWCLCWGAAFGIWGGTIAMAILLFGGVAFAVGVRIGQADVYREELIALYHDEREPK